MDWDKEEISQALILVRDIDSRKVPRRTSLQKESVVALRLSTAVPLKRDIAAVTQRIRRAILPVRHLFREMGFDEHRVFHWRLEHKLVQALVANHYCPGCIPVTRGLKRGLSGMDLDRCREQVQKWCSAGFLIKASLGSCSSERRQVDRVPEILRRLGNFANSETPKSIHQEEFILQKRIEIREEYRVHSLEGKVIPSLTFRRHHDGIDLEERMAPNGYVQSLLNSLPNALVLGTMYAWDVAELTNGGLKVVELNPIGFHPIHQPGFQLSGFFVHADWGYAVTAKFFCFIAEEYGINIEIEADGGTSEEAAVYSRVAEWQQLFQTSSQKRATKINWAG